VKFSEWFRVVFGEIEKPVAVVIKLTVIFH